MGTSKRIKRAPICILAITIGLVLLAYLIDFYPGGYSFKEVENRVIVEKGVFKKETYSLPSTTQNELQIAWLDTSIKNLKTDWFIRVISVGAILIGISHYFENKKRAILITSSSIGIVMAILLYFLYLRDIGYIESLLMTLSKIQ